LGYVCFYRGDNVGAVGAMRDARPITIEAGDRYAEADTLIIEAMAAAIVEGPAEAETLSREVLRIARELRSGRIRTLGLLAAAHAAVRAGQPTLAARRLSAAAKTQREQGIAVDKAEVGRIQAQILIDRGSWAGVVQAARRLGAGVRTSEIILWQPLEPLLRGQALLGAGRLEAARKELSRAEDLARQVEAEPTRELATALRQQAVLQLGERRGRRPKSAGEPETRAVLAENEGIAAIVAGDLPRAAQAFASAVEIRSFLGQTAFLARALAMQAEVTTRLGDRPTASKLNRKARSILRTLGTPEPNKAALLRPLDRLPASAS
jgi:tetratricopeptide (TPR) repeat protein